MQTGIITTEKTQKFDTAEKSLVVIEATKKEILRGILVFWLVSTIFLFLRIFLEAMGADPQSFFAAFIYLISGIFLLPFFGIFPQAHDTIQPGHPTLDSPAFTAIFCYTILVILAVLVVVIVTKMLKTGKQVNETVEKNHPVDPTQSEAIVK
jgi:hypothetical protein